MEAALSESTALSQKSEREYITLRDSLKSMGEAWKVDTDRLRDEMRKREEKLVAESQKIGKMYKDLVEQVKKAKEAKEDVEKVKAEDKARREDIEKYWSDQIASIKTMMEKEGRDSQEANRIAQ